MAKLQKSMDLLATLKANIAANYSDSDSDHSFDEEYYFLKPPPMEFEVGKSCVTNFERLIIEYKQPVAQNYSNLDYSNAIKNANSSGIKGTVRKNVQKKVKTKLQSFNLYLQNNSMKNDLMPNKACDNNVIDINNIIEFPTLGSKRRMNQINRKNDAIIIKEPTTILAGNNINESQNENIVTEHDVQTNLLEDNMADISQNDSTKSTTNISIVNAEISKYIINNCDKYCETIQVDAYEPKYISDSNNFAERCNNNDLVNTSIKLVLDDISNTINSDCDKYVNTNDLQNNTTVHNDIIKKENDCFVSIVKTKKIQKNNVAHVDEPKTKILGNISNKKVGCNKQYQSVENDIKINENSNTLAKKKNNKQKLHGLANKKCDNIIKLHKTRHQHEENNCAHSPINEVTIGTDNQAINHNVINNLTQQQNNSNLAKKKSNTRKQNHTNETTQSKVSANNRTKKKKGTQNRSNGNHQTTAQQIKHPIQTSSLFTNPNMALYKLLLNHRITSEEIGTLLSNHFGNRYIVLSCKRSTFHANKFCEYFNIRTKAVSMSVLSDLKLCAKDDFVHAIVRKPQKPRSEVMPRTLYKKHIRKTKFKIKKTPWLDLLMETVIQKLIICLGFVSAVLLFFEGIYVFAAWHDGCIEPGLVWNFVYNCGMVCFVMIGMYFISKLLNWTRHDVLFKRKLF